MKKHCNCCDTLKNVDDFYFSKSTKDGRQHCCKACSKNNRKKQNARNKKNKPILTLEQKKAKKKENDRQWRIDNPGKARARSRRYDERVKTATPSWLTNNHVSEMDDIYKFCPSGHHVDHIIPLKGENVSGLHVPWNLQYLFAKENIKKGNKF